MLAGSSSATPKNDMPTDEAAGGGEVSTTPRLPNRQYAVIKPELTTPLSPPRLCRQRGQNCLLSGVAKDLCD